MALVLCYIVIIGMWMAKFSESLKVMLLIKVILLEYLFCGSNYDEVFYMNDLIQCLQSPFDIGTNPYLGTLYQDRYLPLYITNCMI